MIRQYASMALVGLGLVLGTVWLVVRADGRRRRKAGIVDAYRDRSREQAQRGLGLMSIGAFVLGAVLMASAAVFTVPANHAGVEVLFGRPVRSYGEGLHLKNPLSVVDAIPGLQQESTYSDTVGEGEKGGPDAVEAVTADNAVVDVDASVLWYLDLAGRSPINIYREYRTLDQVRLRLLRPVSRDAIRDCIARVAFEEARTAERQAIADCARTEIAAQVGANGVIIRAVQIRNMSARSTQLQDGIDSKLTAEQAAREAEFRRVQAEVDAETARIQAEGEANADIARAKGVAEANDLVNASLTTQLLEYRKYEFLSQSGNTNWVIDGAVGGPDLVIPMTDDPPSGGGDG